MKVKSKKESAKSESSLKETDLDIRVKRYQKWTKRSINPKNLKFFEENFQKIFRFVFDNNDELINENKKKLI